MYVAYYGRPGDPGGLNWWAGKLEAAGGDLSEIINSFGSSQEYVDRFGGMSSESLINNIFVQLFGRDADSAGRDWYVGKLESGDPNWSLASIALRIADGVQEGDDDAVVVANRMAVANDFTQAVEDAVVIYIDEQDIDAAVSMLASVNSDAETLESAASLFTDIDEDSLTNFNDTDDDGDGVNDVDDFFPDDVVHFKSNSETVCLGPDWVDVPQGCFVVDTSELGGINQSEYTVSKPAILSIDVVERREVLASFSSEILTQYCSDFAASSNRIPNITAGGASVHLNSWEGDSLGIDSHIESAFITFTDLEVDGGLHFDEFSFQFSIAEQAETVDFSFDPGFNSVSLPEGLDQSFYFLVTLAAGEVTFGKFDDRYKLNSLPEDVRNFLLSIMKNVALLINSETEFTQEGGSSISLLDSYSKTSEELASFANVMFSNPVLLPLEEMWCSDDFETCLEYIPNREFRDVLMNVGADYLAYKDAGVGSDLLNHLKVWAESDAFLNFRNITMGESGQDDIWPRYEINLIMLPVLEVWSLLIQDGIPSQSDIALVESWMGKVLSFSVLTTSGGPEGQKGQFNISYLEASLKMAWGVLQNNDAMFVDGLEKIYLALHQMNDAGGFPREITRGGASYGYQNITMMSVIYMANLARVQGYDVFSWSVDGKTLQTMIDFAVLSAQDPSTLEYYATIHDYYWTPLPINFESALAVDANGRESRFSHGRLFGAWFEPYMALFPSEQWEQDIDSLLEWGLAQSRPVSHEIIGANTSCYFAKP